MGKYKPYDPRARSIIYMARLCFIMVFPVFLLLVGVTYLMNYIDGNRYSFDEYFMYWWNGMP